MRSFATAFLGADAPGLLSALQEGDLLVCNASRRALKAGATSPVPLISWSFPPRALSDIVCASPTSMVSYVPAGAGLGTLPPVRLSLPPSASRLGCWSPLELPLQSGRKLGCPSKWELPLQSRCRLGCSSKWALPS